MPINKTVRALMTHDTLTLEVERLRGLVGGMTEGLCDMVWQFASEGVRGGIMVFHTDGLSALEDAFAKLGMTDPFPKPNDWNEFVDGRKDYLLSRAKAVSDHIADGNKKVE